MRTPEAKLAYDRAYHAANRERIRARKRAWWQANKLEQTDRQRGNKARRRSERYGLSANDVADLRTFQGDRCAGCGSQGPLHIDHDHATGVVRGLLCLQCNVALGWLADDPARMHRLIGYLASPPFAALTTGQRTPFLLTRPPVPVNRP